MRLMGREIRYIKIFVFALREYDLLNKSLCRRDFLYYCLHVVVLTVIVTVFEKEQWECLS